MAEAWLKYFTSDFIEVYSAGTKPETVNPYAVKVMQLAGIDISDFKSNHADEYTKIDFDYVFTVCDNAKEICPIYPNAKKLIHHSFSDPANAIGSEAEQMIVYEKTRDELKNYFKKFANNELK